MIIKKRKAKKSNRGIYIQDKELLDTSFIPNTYFKYVLDIVNKRMIIVPSKNKTRNTVSKRSLKNGILKPVLDIRNKKALEIFKNSKMLSITILDDKVIIEELKDIKSKSSNILLEEVSKTAIFDKSYIKKVVGDSLYEVNQLNYLDGVFLKKYNKKLYKPELPLQIASFFSGAGMMDKAFQDVGFDIKFALEIDKEACKTYRYNLGDHIINGDVKEYNDISGYPIKIGGSPCFGFSNNNRVTHYLDNPNNLLLRNYIDIIENDKKTLIFVIENVPQVLTAGNGLFKKEIYNRLSDFSISSAICNAADYGDPQIRKRAIIIGSKIGKIDIPKPTYNMNNYRTVGDAFEGLNNNIENQLDYSKAKPLTIERMSYVKQGGNIKDIPIEIRPKGQHSDVYKRLEMDKPSITVVNPRKSNIIHPLLNRILSVRECARLQSMPDSFIYKGTLSSKQQQVANGTPYNLMKAIASKIYNHINSFFGSLQLT